MSEVLVALAAVVLIAVIIVSAIVRRSARTADELMTEYLSLGWYGESLHEALARKPPYDPCFSPEQEVASRESWRRRLAYCKSRRSEIARQLRITAGNFEWEAS